jgi:gamma-glutamyltranspeptidase/glutathione hydrolase
MKAHRPTIMGTRHMVAACQYLAAEAGFRILEAGGNAIDAGVAGGIALGVVQPEYVNFAGVAPIISRRTSAARFRRASCAPWCRRRPMPGSPRSSATAR